MAYQTNFIEKQAGDSAIIRLWKALVPLKSVVSFMNTGAHPDDETSSLLTRLSRADGVRIAFCCSTRGQGGQNALGKEKGEALGLLRTREMEEAARVLDMELYWLCLEQNKGIRDFGFSKSGEETFEQWGREKTNELLVRAIRSFRPDIICPTFLNVPGQHGHHRAMTIATGDCFDLAADPNAFPEHKALGLNPWQIKKMYLPAFSGASTAYDDTTPPPPTSVSVSTGNFDPIFGATYNQIAQWSRVKHQTQGMGEWLLEKDFSIPLHLFKSANNLPTKESTIFDGLPTTVSDLAKGLGSSSLAMQLVGIQSLIEKAIASFPNYESVAKSIHNTLKFVRIARNTIRNSRLEPSLASDLDHRLIIKDKQLNHAGYCASLLVLRLESNDSCLVQGDQSKFKLSVYQGGTNIIKIVDFHLNVPTNWKIQTESQRQENRSDLLHGESLSEDFLIDVPKDSILQNPYQFHFDPNGTQSLIHGLLRYEVDMIVIEKAIEPEENVNLLPKLSMEPHPKIALLNLTKAIKSIPLKVSMTLHHSDALEKVIMPNLPENWYCEPPSQKVTFETKGETKIIEFLITPPPSLHSGKYSIEIEADDSVDPLYSLDKILYPHLQPTIVPNKSSFEVQAISVEVPEQLVVGYVEGGADNGADWLERLGFQVEKLSSDMLTTGDLSKYDTIVIGVFGYRTRPELKAANNRIKEYVFRGGNLVTLYHRPWDDWNPKETTPYLLSIGFPSLRWRVTNQNAEVNYLIPDHPLLNYPNQITSEDWDGWVKERGLYFANEWACEYKALLSMADPSESPLTGSLLTAEYGQGRHTHTSLILHHQMDCLVPGAFRIFTNLVSPPR